MKSSDGVLFRVHRCILDACGSNFPERSSSDVVVLPETSSTLDLLFQFIYPLRRPDLKPLEFDTVRLLTICAEQYNVYAARVICMEYMRSVSRIILPLDAHLLVFQQGNSASASTIHPYLRSKAWIP